MTVSQLSRYLPKSLLIALLIHLALVLMTLNQSLWLDEAITANVAQNGIYNYLSQFALSDFHPPLHYFITAFSIQLFGASDLAVRIPSIIFSLATIIVIYFITLRVRPKSADISAMLLATAPLGVYYAIEARMYTQGMFFVSLSILSFLYLVNKHKSARVNRVFSILFVLSLALAYMTHYLTLLIIPIFLLSVPRKFLKQLLIPLGFSFTPLLLWLPYFMQQFSQGQSIGSDWGAILGYATLKNALLIPTKFIIGRISISPQFLYAVVVIILGYTFLYIIGKNKQLLKKHKLFLFWLTTPILIGIIISFWLPVLTYFRFLFALPALYLLLSFGVTSFKKPVKQTLATIVLLTVNLYAVQVYALNPEHQREQWVQAINHIESTDIQSIKVVFATSNPPDPWSWYSSDQIPATGINRHQDLQPQLSSLTQFQVIVLFDYLTDLYDPENNIHDWFNSRGYREVGVLNFHGIGAVRYLSRSPHFAEIN